MIMPALLWFLAYLSALLAESVAVPAITGRFSPLLTIPVLLIGITRLNFWPGLFFALTSGLARDIASPAGWEVHAITHLGIFLAVAGLRRCTQWEEPLAGVGAVAVGLAALVPGRALAVWLGNAVFGTSAAPFGWHDAFTRAALFDAAFIILWGSGFLYLAIARSRLRRARRLAHL